MRLATGRAGHRRRRDWRILLVALIGLDAVALVLAVASANLIRLWLDDLPGIWPLATERHLVASVVVVPVLLILFRTQGLYDFDQILAGTREYARIAHAATYGVIIAVAASYLAGGGPLLVSRTWLLLVWGLSIVCVATARFVLRRVVRQLRRQGVLRTRIVIVGASTFGVAIARQLKAAANEGLDIVGFLDEYIPLGHRLLDDVAVIGRPSDLAHGFEMYPADEYILVPQALPYERLEELTRLMVAREGPIVRLAVSSSELLTNGVLVAERGNVPLAALRRAQITGVDAVLKRGLDLIGTTLALILLAPLVLVVLARGWRTGRRPLFQSQQVHGADGGPVTVWLFDRAVSASLLARGAPALLAVLRGQLGLVGPRPVVYRAERRAPPASGLTTVKPALTGPWRLSGAGASLEHQATQDLTYVRNYTIWEDVRIIWESLCRMRRARKWDPLGRWEGYAASPELADGDRAARIQSPVALKEPSLIDAVPEALHGVRWARWPEGNGPNARGH